MSVGCPLPFSFWRKDRLILYQAQRLLRSFLVFWPPAVEKELNWHSIHSFLTFFEWSERETWGFSSSFFGSSFLGGSCFGASFFEVPNSRFMEVFLLLYFFSESFFNNLSCASQVNILRKFSARLFISNIVSTDLNSFDQMNFTIAILTAPRTPKLHQSS